MKSRKFLQALTVAGVMLGMFTGIPVQAAETSQVTAPGTVQTTVKAMYYYVPTDTFTVTIPKVISISPDKDTTYDINVQGTIDSDRSVWVCTDDTITLSLDGQVSGAESELEVSHTLDKTQFASAEISPDAGYTSQATIGQVDKEYDMECTYSATVTYYINVIGDENVIPEAVQQNGFMAYGGDINRRICKDVLPAEVYEKIKNKSDLDQSVHASDREGFSDKQTLIFGTCTQENNVYYIKVYVSRGSTKDAFAVSKYANSGQMYDKLIYNSYCLLYNITISGTDSTSPTVGVGTNGTGNGFTIDSKDYYDTFYYISPRTTLTVQRE